MSKVASVRRAEQQQQTRTALIDVARRHFSAQGYSATSLDKIAAEAGFTRGAIYANFDGKPGLLLAVLDARLEDQVAELTEVGTDLDELARWRTHNAARERGLAWAVTEFRLVALRDDTLRSQLRERERTLRAAFADLVDQAAASLDLSLPIPSEQAAAALLALGDGLTQQHELDPEAIDQGTFEMVLALLIRGMQADDPSKPDAKEHA